MQVGAYGLTRWTYFVACRLEVVAVAGLMWISGCVFGCVKISCFCFFDLFFFFERIRPAASTYEAALPHLPLY